MRYGLEERTGNTSFPVSSVGALYQMVPTAAESCHPWLPDNHSSRGWESCVGWQCCATSVGVGSVGAGGVHGYEGGQV